MRYSIEKWNDLSGCCQVGNPADRQRAASATRSHCPGWRAGTRYRMVRAGWDKSPTHCEGEFWDDERRTDDVIKSKLLLTETANNVHQDGLSKSGHKEENEMPGRINFRHWVYLAVAKIRQTLAEPVTKWSANCIKWARHWPFHVATIKNGPKVKVELQFDQISFHSPDFQYSQLPFPCFVRLRIRM